MTDLEPFVVIVGFCVLVIGVALTLGIHRFIAKPSDEEDFQARLSQLRRSELEEDETEENKGWFSYWNELYRLTGRVPVDDNSAGRGLLIVGVMSVLLGAFVFPGGIVGALLFPPFTLFAVRVIFKMEAQKRKNTLEKQLPLLISSLRANVQSRSTPQSALMQVADEIPSPLGDELKILKSELNVNIPLEQALKGLSDRVNSEQIRFLVASIGMAVSSGQDLDPQLENIQTIIDARAVTEQKLAAAIANASTAVWVSALIIPGMFLFTWFTSDDRSFWTSLWGIATLAGVGLLYAAGLWIMNVLVKNVRNT